MNEFKGIKGMKKMITCIYHTVSACILQVSQALFRQLFHRIFAAACPKKIR